MTLRFLLLRTQWAHITWCTSFHCGVCLWLVRSWPHGFIIWVSSLFFHKGSCLLIAFLCGDSFLTLLQFLSIEILLWCHRTFVSSHSVGIAVAYYSPIVSSWIQFYLIHLQNMIVIVSTHWMVTYSFGLIHFCFDMVLLAHTGDISVHWFLCCLIMGDW